jgi:hypothetical protein
MAARREAATERQSVSGIPSSSDSPPFGSQNRTSETVKTKPQITGKQVTCGFSGRGGRI